MCNQREDGCRDGCSCPCRFCEAEQLRYRREQPDERHAQRELDDRRAACSPGAGRQVGDEEKQAAGDRAHDGVLPVPSENHVFDGMSRELAARLAESHGVLARFRAIIRAKAMMVHEGATPQAEGKRLASATWTLVVPCTLPLRSVTPYRRSTPSAFPPFV